MLARTVAPKESRIAGGGMELVRRRAPMGKGFSCLIPSPGTGNARQLERSQREMVCSHTFTRFREAS